MRDSDWIVGADGGECLNVIGDRLRVLQSSPGTGFEVVELTGQRDSGPPAHRHPWTESFYCLDGELDLAIGEHGTHVRTGDVVRIPADAVHTFRVTSERVRLLAMSDGPSVAFFREMHEKPGGATPTTPEALASIMKVCAAHGLQIMTT